MKVRVSFTIEVDPKKWRDYYAMPTDFTAADIRADINDVAENLLLDDLADTGAVFGGAA